MAHSDDEKRRDGSGTESGERLAGDEFTDQMHDGEAEADDRNGATTGDGEPVE